MARIRDPLQKPYNQKLIPQHLLDETRARLEQANDRAKLFADLQARITELEIEVHRLQADR